MSFHRKEFNDRRTQAVLFEVLEPFVLGTALFLTGMVDPVSLNQRDIVLK